MITDDIILLCYWDGSIAYDEQGITYKDAIPKASKINRGMKHCELNDKMHKLIGADSRLYKLRITCRYLATGKYIGLPIDDDESVDIMLDMTKELGINCVELYLEKSVIQFGSDLNMCSITNDGPFTRLLMQESDASERMCLSPPNLEFSFQGTCTGVKRKSSKINDLHEQHSNVNLVGIQKTVELEDYACLIQGTDINNDLVEDETEENLQEIDSICASFREPFVPEFTNIDRVNTAILSQWVPWVDGSSKNPDQEFYIGQRFGTKAELQGAVKLYSLKCHQEYAVVLSNPALLVLKCKQGKSCAWKLRASIPKGATHFEVKTYTGPHSCVNPILNRHHKQLDTTFIASRIMKVVKAQLSFSPAAIQAMISDDIKYDITYKQAWKAKMRTIKELFGDWKESYNLLPRYMNALQRQNPGTVVLWQKDQGSKPNEETFKRVFWAFGAQ